MKNILLFAAFVFSMNADAQNLQPVSSGRHVRTTSIENLNSKLEGAGIKSGIPGFTVAKDIRHSSRELLDLIQLIDSTYLYAWDTSSLDWVLDSKTDDITYNDDGLPLSLTALTWTGADWENAIQYIYTYDGNNNPTVFVVNGWNGTAWQAFFRSTSTYDANNNLTSQVEQFTNGITLVNSGRATFTYDANNNSLTEVYESWNGSAWEYFDQYLYTYDVNNNNITVVYQTWDGVAWLNDTKDNNSFDGNKNNTHTLIQSWNGTSWEDDVNATMTYDANNNLLSETDQLWNGTEWENLGQTTYTYNANNNVTSVLGTLWDGSDWSNFSLFTYTYDGNYNLINERLQIWNDVTWVISMNTINTYDTDNFLESRSFREYDETGTIVILGDSTFNYFHTATGIKDLSAGDNIMEVYPNPTNGQFSISSETTLLSVEVFNLLGARIYSSELEAVPTNDINLSGFDKGIYIVSTTDGVKHYSRKIVVQ